MAGTPPHPVELNRDVGNVKRHTGHGVRLQPPPGLLRGREERSPEGEKESERERGYVHPRAVRMVVPHVDPHADPVVRRVPYAEPYAELRRGREIDRGRRGHRARGRGLGDADVRFVVLYYAYVEVEKAFRPRFPMRGDQEETE